MEVDKRDRREENIIFQKTQNNKGLQKTICDD